MDVLTILASFNIINLLNTVLPKGVGEFIVLICWLGFFGEGCLIAAAWALTKEQVWINAICRITMQEIGIVVYPGGSIREFKLHRDCEEFTVKMGEKECKWTISPDEWMTKSNGVRFTFFHPTIPHNISLNNLVRILNIQKTKVIVGIDIEEVIPIENITYTAFDQDAKVHTLAMAYAQDLADPNKKLINAAIAISLVLAVGIVGAMIFILLPSSTSTATNTVTTLAQTVATTVTTIPKTSGIH